MMGDLEWAQGIQGLTQGVLAGVNLARGGEELQLKRQALKAEQFKPFLESYRKAETDLVQKTGELKSLQAIAAPTEDQIKRRDLLASEVQGLIAVLKAAPGTFQRLGLPLPKTTPPAAPGPPVVPGALSAPPQGPRP